MNDLITKVFEEQPLALPGSAKNDKKYIFVIFVGLKDSSIDK